MDTVFNISLLRIEGVQQILKSKPDIKQLRQKYSSDSFVLLDYNGANYEVVSDGDYIYYSAIQKKQTVRAKFVSDFRDNIQDYLISELANKKLNPMYSAIFIDELQYVCNVKQSFIADKANLTYGAISNKKRLNNLPSKVQSAIIKGQLTERHGRAILRLKSTDNFEKLAEQVCARVVDEELNVSQCENVVKQILGLPQTRGVALNIKNLEPSQLENPETQMVINYVGQEVEKTIAEINKFFPNLEVQIEDGIDKEDFVFLLKLKGINKNG